MSDSGSDRSRHRHRRRKTPFIAFYGPVGGNGFGSGHHYGRDEHHGREGPHISYYRNDHRSCHNRRSSSPSSLAGTLWIVEAMERLAADITSCGYEPRKPSKPEKKEKLEEEGSSEQDKEVIETMNAKLSKLENAMKSLQDILQTCLARLRGGGEDGVDELARRAGNPTQVRRQRRLESPDWHLYCI